MASTGGKGGGGKGTSAPPAFAEVGKQFADLTERFAKALAK